ncbi:MAG TPA: hypothetical protein VEW05_03345 [Candidatus Polarisedimenticolia bacterium]|nr:hypothetical protein [Candidatus Polarisedimenticolia bacterium]
MRVKLAACLGMLGTLAGMNCLGQGEKAGKAAPVSASKLERMPESLEIRFALSAAPPHLRDNATTYVLDPAKGYVLSHKGTNGVSCIVVRSDWQFPNQPFRDDIFWPVCYDAEGSRNLLQDYIHAAELRARGMNAKEVHQEVTKQFGTADSPNPSRTGVAYMIAPVMRGFVHAGVATMNMPHYMFYAPNVRDTDIGGNGFSKEYPFVLSMNTGRDDYIIVLVGEAEKTKILLESNGLLSELCSFRDYLCTTAATRARTPID